MDTESKPKTRNQPPEKSPRHDMAVVVEHRRGVALIRYIYAESGRVEELFGTYLQQKIKEQ